jgi:hypothetical protein
MSTAPSPAVGARAWPQPASANGPKEAEIGGYEEEHHGDCNSYEHEALLARRVATMATYGTTEA